MRDWTVEPFPVQGAGRAVAPADPVVGQRGLRPDPLVRVHRQHPVDEVLGLGGHRVPLGGVELVGAGFNLVEVSFRNSVSDWAKLT